MKGQRGRARWRRVRGALAVGLLRLLRLLVAPLGWRGTQRLGSLLGKLGWCVARRDRRRTLANLAIAFPERSASDRRRLGRACFAHFGTTLLECVRLLDGDCDDARRHVRVEGWEGVEELRRQGRSILIVAGHCGNWELLAATIGCRCPGWSTLARQGQDPRLDALLVGLRARYGTRTIARGDAGAARALLGVLRGPGMLGILIDQDADVEGAWVPFFGRPAYTPLAAAQIGRRRGVAAVPTFIERLADGSHVARFEPALELPEDAVAATALMTHRIEEQVRRRPEQWVWMHRRWRRQPPGSAVGPQASRAALVTVVTAAALLVPSFLAPASLPGDHGWRRVDLCATHPTILRGHHDAVAAVRMGQSPDLATLPLPANAPQGGAVLSAPRVRALRQRVATTIAWRVRLGRDPYLAFTPLADAPACPASATVAVATPGGKPAVLWRGEAPRVSFPAGPEVSVDLASWAGREVDLSFDVRRTAPDPRPCVMVWASPEVVSRSVQPAGPRVANTPPNLLLIGADTLRASALGAWGQRPSVTPALDALAAESDVWLDAFSTSNATNPSFASIHTGLFVLHHGVRDLATPLPAARSTLAERLSAAGYDTFAVFAAQHLNPRRSGLGQGFAATADAEDTSAARLAVDQAIDWLQQPRRRPFFLWLHLFDPHAPHLPPAPFALGQRAAAAYGLSPVRAWTSFRSLGLPAFREKRLAAHRDLYLGEVAYLDRQTDRLLGFLRSRGLLDQTVVVFVADHGENLEEHGINYRHAGLWDTTTHVPLMIRWPTGGWGRPLPLEGQGDGGIGAERDLGVGVGRGAAAGFARGGGKPPGARPAGRRLRGLVQTIDLYPTLLAAAGLRPEPTDGRDLRAITSGGRTGRPAVYAEQADGKGASVRTADWRFFLSVGSRLVPAGPYLYDLARDPDEKTNLAGRGRVEEHDLRTLLARFLRSRTATAPQAKLTAEEEAALRALGYQ